MNQGEEQPNKAKNFSLTRVALIASGFCLILIGFLFLVRQDQTPPIVTQASIEYQDSVIIPSLKVEAPVVISDTWEDKTVTGLMEKGVVMLPTPWISGDHKIITAHSSGAVSLGSKAILFSKIDELKSGDLVYLLLNNQKTSYKVRNQIIVKPDEVDKVPKDGSPTLTLVSCWPVGSNSKRILVIADKVN